MNWVFRGLIALVLGWVLVLGHGIPASASCAVIPDYSTQEYRPSPAPETALDPQPEEDPSAAAEETGNAWQRFWRGLFGG